MGDCEGHFENLDMYCALAFDRKADVTHLCLTSGNGLFVWNKETLDQLKRKGGNMKTLQLDAISYLWELCYDLLLALGENVLVSPGFEAFGLRVNRLKRSRGGE